ncbi:MAG: cytochrome c biogenesis protein CcsA [Caldisericia bacterium]|nr:cytochrome c biogenesis protein CcsA [Caldisericia bacterium]
MGKKIFSQLHFLQFLNKHCIKKKYEGFIMVGTGFLYISAFLSLISAVFLLNNKKFKKLAHIGIYFSVGLIFFSFLYYVYLFLAHSFEFVNVFNNSCLSMSTLQLIACSWSGQSGSLFLWIIFTGFTVLIARKNMVDKVWKSVILLGMQLILLLLLIQSKPFAVQQILVSDGMGLNPVLSNPLMVLHPPFAFLAYSFIGLFFSAGLASLIEESNNEWIKENSYSLYFAFFGLTVAIILGSFWAYEIIGWGGYWAFDPVESGSLSLWLCVVALLHMLDRKGNPKKSSSLFYIIPIFSVFSMYYVSFLIRSGLLQSFTAHSYAKGGLVSALYGICLIFFIIPISVFLIKKRKNKERKKLDHSKCTKVKEKYFVAKSLFCLGIILFLQVNLPIIQISSELILRTNEVIIDVFLISFMLLLNISQINMILEKKYSKKTMWVSIFMSFVLTICIVLVYAKLKNSRLFWVYLVTIFSAFYWIFSNAFVRVKSWQKVSIKIIHVAIGLIIPGIVLTSALSQSWQLYVGTQKPKVLDEYQLIQLDNQKKIDMYIGNKTTFFLECKGNNLNVIEFNPEIWNYSRNYTNFSMTIPSINTSWKKDLQLIPFTENGIQIKNSKTTTWDSVEYYLESLEFEEKLDIIKQKARLKIRSNNTDDEEFYLLRMTNKSGRQLNPVRVYSEITKGHIMWIDTDEDSIIITTDKRMTQRKYELIEKPGMVWIKFGFVVLIIGSFLLMYFFLVNRFQKKRKKSKINNYE